MKEVVASKGLRKPVSRVRSNKDRTKVQKRSDRLPVGKSFLLLICDEFIIKSIVH